MDRTGRSRSAPPRSLALSRRRKETRSGDGPPDAARGVLAQRVLLGAVTALVVARPLVAGEDPGHAAAPEAVSGLILNVLWLIVALGGAIWLALFGRPVRWGGWLAVGLIGAAGLVALSASRSDGYRLPGWLIACEWGLLPILFILTRSLTADDDPDADSAGGLLAALLASVVSVAGFTVYQAVADMARGVSPDLPLHSPTPVPPGDDLRDLRPSPVEPDWVAHGTLERSDTLSGLLLLVIPLAGAFALRGRSRKARLALAALVLMVLAWAVSTREFVKFDLPGHVRGGWTAAARMIAERPLFGVGPGNFDRHSPRLLPAAAPEPLAEPWGAYPELAATCGIPALLALLGVSIGALFAIRRSRVPTPEAPLPDLTDDRLPRWEFYLGGVAGLLLGLLLRVIDLPGAEPPQTILSSAYGAVGRALIWFLAFALFESVSISAVVRRKALLTGLSLVLVTGLVSGALLRPALAQMVWIVAALALSGELLPATAPHPPRLVRALPVGFLLGAVIAYAVVVVQPTVKTAQLLTHAHRAATVYVDDRIQSDAEAATGPEEKVAKRGRAKGFLEVSIVGPLAQAVRSRPGDPGLRTELAGWLRVNWKLAPNLDTEKILDLTRKAAAADPHAAAPLVREFQLRATFATIHPNVYPDPSKYVEYTQKLRDKQFVAMEALIPEILARDPTMELRLRYRAIQAMLDVKDDKRYAEALQLIPDLLERDAAEARPRWKLTAYQRIELDKWLKGQS